MPRTSLPTGLLVTSWELAAFRIQMSNLRDHKREISQCPGMNRQSGGYTDFRGEKKKKDSRWKAALALTFWTFMCQGLWSSLNLMSTGCTKKNASHPPAEEREAAAHLLQSFLCSFVYRAELRLVQNRVPHFLPLLPLSLTRCDSVTILLSCQHHGGKYK